MRKTGGSEVKKVVRLQRLKRNLRKFLFVLEDRKWSVFNFYLFKSLSYLPFIFAFKTGLRTPLDVAIHKAPLKFAVCTTK